MEYCIVCREYFPPGISKIHAGGFCICEDCYRNMDKFKTPMVFEELGVQCIGINPYSGILKKAFLDYKFHGQREYYKVFASVFRDGLLKMIKKEDFDLIIPVPVSRKRMNERGYNQTALFAEVVACDIGIEYTENALLRTRNTRKQSTLSSSERFKNVEGAFYADRRILEGKHILLADDIHTMGATMSECAKTLKEAGASKVIGGVLFKSIKPGRGC